MKAQELVNYILGKRAELDFSKPNPVLHRMDSEPIRNRILSMTTAEARKLGIRNTTLHYLRKRATGDGSFLVYGKIRAKINQRSLHGHNC